MKKIIIIEKELQDKFLDGNKRIVYKKNKTIVKDKNLIEDPSFIESIKEYEYSWYLEEWEILTPEKTQLICANNGIKLRPIHIISSVTPRNGAKALFQSKKLIVLKIQDGVFELSKNTISDTGEVEINILTVGEYTSVLDIKRKLDKNYIPMLTSYIKNSKEFLDGYLSPIWSQC